MQRIQNLQRTGVLVRKILRLSGSPAIVKKYWINVQFVAAKRPSNISMSRIGKIPSVCGCLKVQIKPYLFRCSKPRDNV